MPNAKLIIVEAGKEPRELEILGDVTTFGRAKDNSVSFPSDGNVSRFHGQIERKDGDYFISDFGSANGTIVNGQPFSGEKLLQHNDKINFGGDNSYVVFNNEESSSAEDDKNNDAESASPNSSSQPNASENSKSSIPLILTGAAILSGLAIVAVVVLVVATQTNVLTGTCAVPEVSILSPESGSAIVEPTEIRVQVKNTKCLDRIAYSIDGEEIASAETAPYSVTLDPENLRELHGDTVHILTVAVVNRDGTSKMQKDELELTFGEAVTDPVDKSGGKSPTEAPPDKLPGQKTTQITIAETKTLSEQFLKQFPGAYKLNLEFLTQVQKETAEYRSEGFSGRAAQFRDVINQTFVGEQGLDPSLGYILAMSRSEFENKKNGSNEGLWQMANDFAASNGYNGQCGAETLSDVKQNCAAHAAAIYTKALVGNLFQGDVLYAVSCFGMSPSEAGQFQISLPPDRSDFWNVIKSPKQRDALVRFFAAGIVAENPQRFGLKQDKPLSNLYKVLMSPK